MNIGKMRHRITFQRQSGEKGGLGGYSDDWKDERIVWAQISPISGREYLSQVRETTVSHKIYCRYHADITPAMRIKYKERTFRIVSVIDWDERHEGLTIMCEEVVN